MLAFMFLNQVNTARKLQGSLSSVFRSAGQLCLVLIGLAMAAPYAANGQTLVASHQPAVVCEGSFTTLFAGITGLPSGVSVDTFYYHFNDPNPPSVPSNPRSTSTTNLLPPGVYNTYIVAKLTDGSRVTSPIHEVIVYRKPIPNYEVVGQDTQCLSTNLLCFNNLSAQAPAPSTSIKRFLWVWGDGFFDSTYNFAQKCHTYNRDGSYNVTLRAIDSLGCTRDVQTPVGSGNVVLPVVIIPEMKLGMTWRALSGPCFTSGYFFTNTSLAKIDSLKSYTYNFGDGKTFTANAPFSAADIAYWDTIRHTYTTNGQFTVSITAVDKYNCVATKIYASPGDGIPKNIVFEFDVIATKTAADIESRDSVCIGSGNSGSICFKQTPIDLVQLNTPDVLWEFDDPQSMQRNFDRTTWTPCHQFVGGMKTYNVKLTIDNVCGYPVTHTYFAAATFDTLPSSSQHNGDVFLDKVLSAGYNNNDMFDPNATPIVYFDTVVRPGKIDGKRKLVWTGGIQLSADSLYTTDTMYAYQDVRFKRPIYWLNNDSVVFKAVGVPRDTIELPFNFEAIVRNRNTTPPLYDTFQGYRMYGYGVRVIGPFARIPNPQAIPPVVIASHQLNQCGPTDTVDFVNTSMSFKSRMVYRRWDFDDNYAPQCTSFTVPKPGFPKTLITRRKDSVTYDGGKTYMKFGPDTLAVWTDAVEQYNNSYHYFIQNGQTYPGKMNCKFSYDTLPRHHYPNWDSVYQWHLRGKDFLPWTPTTFGNGPGLIPVHPSDTLFWGKPVYLNPETGTWSLTQGNGPAPYGQWARIDTMDFRTNNSQDLRAGHELQIAGRAVPDPFIPSDVSPTGAYPVITTGRIRPTTSVSYRWKGRTYTYSGSRTLPGTSMTFYHYVFNRTVTRCLNVRLLLRDSFNNESTKEFPNDSNVLDTLDCRMEATLQLPFAKADARGMGKQGKECPGGGVNGVAFELAGIGASFPGVLPNCGQTFILFNFDSLADRQDGTPCALDAFVPFGGGNTPGGLSYPPFFPTPNFQPQPWTSPAQTRIVYHYGLNAPQNRPAPANFVQGYITVGLAIGSGCKEHIVSNVLMSAIRQAVPNLGPVLLPGDLPAITNIPVSYAPGNTPVPGAAANYNFSFIKAVNQRQIILGNIDTLVDLQYQDCAWAQCMSDTVWYHNFLTIQNLSSRFDIDALGTGLVGLAQCRLRHKGEEIMVHYEDTFQDNISYSNWAWGDNTVTVDSFYYIPDSFDVCLDSVRTDILMADYRANKAFYDSPINAPIPASRRVMGGATTYQYKFSSLANVRVQFNGVGFDSIVDLVYQDCRWSDGYYSAGVRRVRYNFDLGDDGNTISLIDSTVWPVNSPGIGIPGLASSLTNRLPVRTNNFNRVFTILDRTAVTDSIIVQYNCTPFTIDTLANADTMAYYPIVQFNDPALGMYPVKHTFKRTSWEVAGKLPGAQTGNILHSIRSTKGCDQASRFPITIGWIDTLSILNSAGLPDTNYCENEDVYFVDSLRYFRFDCRVTNVQDGILGTSRSQAGSFIHFLPPYNEYQFDSADFWRQDLGDPRTIQNITPYVSWRYFDPATGGVINVVKRDTIVPERVYWDFGDGSPIDSSSRPVHRYKQFGRYQVTMVSRDSLGFFDTCLAIVNISAPVAKIDFLRDALGVPRDLLNCGDVAFFLDSSKMATTAASSLALVDSIEHNYWWFGDNKIDTVTPRSFDNPAPGWKYNYNGLYQVKLVVETYQGCKDTVLDTVFIRGPRPRIALLNPSDTVGCAPFKVRVVNWSDSLGKYVDPQGNVNPADTPTRTTVVYWGDNKNTQSAMFFRYDTTEFSYDTAGVYYIYALGSDGAFGGQANCDPVLYPDTPNMRPIRIEVKSLRRELLLDKDVVCVNNPVAVQNNSDPAYTQYTYLYENRNTSTLFDSTTNNQSVPYTFTRSFSDTGNYRIIARPDILVGFDPELIKTCLINDTLDVKVIAPAPAFSLQKDTLSQSTPLIKMTNLSDTSLNFNYLWELRKTWSPTVLRSSNATNENPDYTIDIGEDTGYFQVCLTSYAKGLSLTEACADSVCDTFSILFTTSFDIPNVFTPNGDGKNDFFRVAIQGEQEFKVTIYNRWGAKVFESGAASESWNGKNQNDGSECPSGVYYYVLDYKLRGRNSESKSGTVTLIRN